jgi:hypothetical protein
MTTTQTIIETLKTSTNERDAEVHAILLEQIRIYKNTTEGARREATRIAKVATELDAQLAAGFISSTDMIGSSREDLQRYLTQRQVATDTIRMMAYALGLDVYALFAEIVAG